MNIELVGMGMRAKDTDIGNYRIVSNFKNDKNEDCFIEIAHYDKEGELYGMVRQAYKIEGRNKKHMFLTIDRMYNSICKYDLESVIKKINALFECSFTSATVVKYTDKLKGEN